MFHLQTRNGELKKITVGRHDTKGAWFDLLVVFRLEETDFDEFGLSPTGCPENTAEIKCKDGLGKHLVHLAGIGRPWSHIERFTQVEKVVFRVVDAGVERDDDQYDLPGMTMTAEATVDLQVTIRVESVQDDALIGLVRSLTFDVACTFLCIEQARMLIEDELRRDGTLDKLTALYPDADMANSERRNIVKDYADSVVYGWHPGDGVLCVLDRVRGAKTATEASPDVAPEAPQKLKRLVQEEGYTVVGPQSTDPSKPPAAPPPVPRRRRRVPPVAEA